jgi:hypothetical protein
MLPKPEKGKKLNHNFLSDSEITKESDEIVNAKKTKTKRKIILFSLICTAGLSLIFWTVKGIQSFTASPHPLNLNFHFNFKLPSFKFEKNIKVSTDISTSDLDNFLSSQNLSATIFKNSDFSNSVYQYNFSNTNATDFISELSKTKPTETSSIVSGLPEGLSFQEKLDNDVYGLIVNLPEYKLTFIIQDNKKSINFTQNISSFINQAYWYSVAQE